MPFFGMTEYMFYLLGFDGYLVGGTTLDCSDDTAAISHAKGLLDTFNAAVEVWKDARKVGQIGGQRLTLPDSSSSGTKAMPKH